MENKLQELTEKLYNDGIEKARVEAAEIVANARKQAGEVIKNAQTEAAAIIENARNDSKELQKKTESELKLSSKQVIAAIKNQVTNLVVNDLLTGNIEKGLDDAEFVKSLIELMVKKWHPDDAHSIDLQIILPTDKKEQFEKIIKSKINNLLAKGLSVQFDDQFSSGFKISPSDNSYIVNFAADDFDNFFKTYLRAKTANLLYGE